MQKKIATEREHQQQKRQVYQKKRGKTLDILKKVLEVTDIEMVASMTDKDVIKQLQLHKHIKKKKLAIAFSRAKPAARKAELRRLIAEASQLEDAGTLDDVATLDSIADGGLEDLMEGDGVCTM